MQDKLEWIIEPSETEVINTQLIKGNTTKSVGFSVVYPDGTTGYLIVGKVFKRMSDEDKKWQIIKDIKQIIIKWQ